MENVNIYELKSAANDIMNGSEEIMNLAIKQAVDLDSLERMSSDELKTYGSLKRVFDAFKKFITVEADAITAMYEKQKDIDRKLDEINRKLDRLDRLGKHE